MKKVITLAIVALLGLSSCKKDVQCQCKMSTETLNILNGDTIKNNYYGYKWITVKNSTPNKAKKSQCASTSSSSSIHNPDNSVTQTSESVECSYN